MSHHFWAHSDPVLPASVSGSKWQLLSDHLTSVSKLSCELAAAAAPSDKHFQDLASYAGLLHDLGKYSDCFQQMLLGKPRKCLHAIHGAALATQPPFRSNQVAYAIAGHHAGLPDRVELANGVRQHLAEARKLLDRANEDCSEIKHVLEGPLIQLENIAARADLFTRMLFSCLVDADRLDSAQRGHAQLGLNAPARLKALLSYVAGLTGGSETVRQARQQVLAQCLEAAAQSHRMLSLSVPTGGGKTLAGMALALQRASFQPSHRRIIVVIPYLSIIEQNAAVYRSVFGDEVVLEHHSGNFEPLVATSGEQYAHGALDESRYRPPTNNPETENWDVPCIVTTSVRFFESLFSNRPSDLRRVHNIARSIVILDEVQVLPRRLLNPILAIIEELCRDWGCTFILSTATKPAFERPAHPDPALVSNPRDRRWEPGTLHEVVPDPQSLHARLRRTRIKWRIKEPAGWQEVAGWMREEGAALCVVNTRDHAQQLYEALKEGNEPRAVFHLSTRMCAAHRLEVISRIRQRLREEHPILVVSTQLIEAGVDLDFPVVFRAMGPLDSIIQAAGRADREGKLTARLGRPAGRLTVFMPEDHRMPPNEYREAAGITHALVGPEPDVQTDDLPALARYFERYYRDGDTGADLLQLRAESRFKTLSQNFEMINSLTRDVLVPFEAGKGLIDRLHADGFLTRDLRRALQQYSVGLLPYEFERARAQFNQVRDQEIWTASEAHYDGELGLRLDSTHPLIL